MTHEMFAALIAEHMPTARAREAHALACALVLASDPHAARIAWLDRNLGRAKVDVSPIQAIKELRGAFQPTPTLKEAKDAVDAYRAAS